MYREQHEAIFAPQDSAGRPARFSLIEAGTKTGKTVGCIVWLFERCLAGKPGQNFWWVAPVYGQAEIAYRRTKLAVPRELIRKSNDSDLRVEYRNGTFEWFKSGEKSDNLYGEDVFAAVIDEASRLRETSWHAIRSVITATRGPLRCIGNVRGRKNWFYQLARKAQAGEPNMSYHKIVAANAVAAGILDAQEILDAQRDLPEQVFRELYLAEPSDDGGNPFGFDHIGACVGEVSAEPPVAWGWDLAKRQDWTVGIGLDRNGVVCRFERFRKPWFDTIKTIIDLTGMLTPALVDSTGVGDPILELLQKEQPAAKFEGYHFHPASKQKLMEGLAVAIQRREVTYPDGVIKTELEDFEYEYTRTGVRYTAPEGFYDDAVCALALAVQCKGRAPDLSIWNKLIA